MRRKRAEIDKGERRVETYVEREGRKWKGKKLARRPKLERKAKTRGVETRREGKSKPKVER